MSKVSLDAQRGSADLTSYDVRETSVEAYQSIAGELGDRQREVLNVMLQWGKPINNRMIAEMLDRPHNEISPRVKELREEGVVERAGKSTCPHTGRKTLFWQVKEEVRQDE